MAQTITTKTPRVASQVATGRYLDTGTVAAYTFSDLGFKPRYVKIQNLNASGLVSLEWYEGMADDSAVKTGADGAISVITSLGITVTDRGFTMGLDTDLNVTSEQISWLAIG